MWRSAASNIISLLVVVMLLAGGIGLTAKSFYISEGPLETAICIRIPGGSSFRAVSEELEKIEGWPYPEFSDKAKFDNFLYMMMETRYFKENNEGRLFASKITKRAKKLYEKFFDNEFLSFIENKIN